MLAFGVRTKNPSDEAVEFVYSTRRRQKHERALTGDDLNAVLLAVRQGFFTDRAFAAGPVHPNAANSRCGTIRNDGIRDLGGGHQQRSIHWRPNVLYSREAGPTHDLRCFRVNGNYVIAAAFEFLK